MIEQENTLHVSKRVFESVFKIPVVHLLWTTVHNCVKNVPVTQSNEQTFVI